MVGLSSGVGRRAVFVWFALLGPAICYAEPGLPLTVELEVLHDDARTTLASDEWARAIAAQLAPHGFIARARYRMRGPKQPFDFAQRLDNLTTGEVATIFAGWRPRPDGGEAIPIRTLVFHTRVRDDGEVMTTNSFLPSLNPPFPGQRAYRLPDVHDPAALYSIHQRLVKQDGRRPVPIVLGDDPLVWDRKRHERSIALQLRHGLAVPDEKAGRLRVTLKGAFRTTWLYHPLLMSVQDRRATRKAAAALGLMPA